MNVCKAIPAQTEGGCRKVETYQMCILFLLIITLPAWGEHLSMIAFFVVVVLTIHASCNNNLFFTPKSKLQSLNYNFIFKFSIQHTRYDRI